MCAEGESVELDARMGDVAVVGQDNDHTWVAGVVESEHLVTEGQGEDRGPETVAGLGKIGALEDQEEGPHIAAHRFHHMGERAEEGTATPGEPGAPQPVGEELDEDGQTHWDQKIQQQLEEQEDEISAEGTAKDGLEKAGHCARGLKSGEEGEIEGRAMAGLDDAAGAWAPEPGEAAEWKELRERAGPAAGPVPVSSVVRKPRLQAEHAPAQTGRSEGQPTSELCLRWPVAGGRLGAFYPLDLH